MPSYRTILTVATMEPGHAPTEVEQVARAPAHPDSFDVSIANGQARATIRFTAADDESARRLHADLCCAIRAIASVPRARLALVRGRRNLYFD